MNIKLRSKISVTMVLFFVFSLILPYLPGGNGAGTPVAMAADTQTIGDLQIGDKLVDNSWEWEHRLGPDSWEGVPYSGTGVTKPVTWIVVAKDHYGQGGVTLLTEEVIARHTFDNSTDRGSIYGSNHWGDSGSTDAAYGLRRFLNGTSYDYSSGYGGGYSGAAAATGDDNTYDVTFFDTFSTQFQAAVLNTAVPCRENDGTDGGEDNPYTNEEYTTNDKVFLPSQVELNGATGYNHSAEAVWPYFSGATNADRIAMEENGKPWEYLIRSPHDTSSNSVRFVHFDGTLNSLHAYDTNRGVRPALTLKSDITISGTPNADGVYEIQHPPTIGDLEIGDKVVDNSWQWEYRLGGGYTDSYLTKTVNWIVVAKNHYDGLEPHVTLLSEELIGLYFFDNSTNRGSAYGSNHWGDSGSTNAINGLRPWLNSTGIHGGEGFYNALSDDFKGGILTTTLPNKVWNTGDSYATEDKVFIPSTSEMGDTEHSLTYEIGTVYPYFEEAEDEDRLARLGENSFPWYWTRSPNSLGSQSVKTIYGFVASDEPAGYFSSYNANHASHGVRPALNLASEILISGTPNENGSYEIIHTHTVTFKDWNDAILVTDTVQHGNSATAPDDPTRTGYIFTGWDTDFSEITGDLTVTATYQEKTLTPEITTETQTINNLNINITGTAEPNSDIIIKGGAEEAVGLADAEGNFSIEVTLTEDSENVLIITAQAPGKGISDEVTLVITHETVSRYGYVLDGESISVADAIAVLRHIVGLTDLKDPDLHPAGAYERAKVSGGDTLTVQDAILILRYIVGLIEEFPVEKT